MSKKNRSNFRNQTVSDAKRQKREASSYGYLNLPKGVKILTLKENTREIFMDIIPYRVTDTDHPDRDVDENRAVEGGLWYKRPFKIHRDIGVNNNKFVCRTSIGKKCPICVWVADQRRQGVTWDDIKEVAAKDRDLYAVLPIDSKDHDDIIHVWDMSWHLFQKELNAQLEEDEDIGRFPELEEGLTLKVKFRWEKFGKGAFPETRDISFEERGQQYTEDILEDVPNLDEILNVLSYKELEAKFLEMEDDEATDDDTVTDTEDEPERTSQRHRKSAESEEKKETTKRERRERREHEEEKTDNKCPNGLTFGKDCASDKVCDDCEKFDDCDDEQTKQEG